MTVTYCYLGGENYKVEVYNKRQERCSVRTPSLQNIAHWLIFPLASIFF